MPSSARDVAQYVLDIRGPMPAMKLQKLLYYCQAWSLVWDDKALFGDSIEAWANGPVVRDVWAVNRYEFEVKQIDGAKPWKISRDDSKTIEAVLKFYGNKTARELSDLTHMESPWMEARKRAGVRAGESSDEPISITEMQDYYRSRSHGR